MRRCNKCHVEKSLDAFYPSKKCKLGRIYTCTECKSALSIVYRATASAQVLRAAYHRTDDAKARKAAYRKSVSGQFAIFQCQMRKNYGIEVEDWARLFNVQGGKCAACRIALRFDRSTHVDHSHVTGAIRGLLCRYCNTSLGLAKDDVARLRALVQYLEAA